VVQAGDRSDREALLDAVPDVDNSTPLAAQLAQDTRRRIELHNIQLPQPRKTRIFTVANQKGGVGKTTTSVNIAAALARAGLRVLVIDNDPQGNTSTALNIDHPVGTPSTYDVLINGLPISEAVQDHEEIPTLQILPATIDLSGAEIELVMRDDRESGLRNALQQYLKYRDEHGLPQIDYVFIDCPPSLGLLTLNAFVAGDEVLIPIQTEYYALEGLSQLLSNIGLIQKHLNRSVHVSTIILTMFDNRTNLSMQVEEEVRTHFPDQTLTTVIPRSIRVSEAPGHGQTVMTYDPRSTGALAYLEAAREIALRGGNGEEEKQHD